MQRQVWDEAELSTWIENELEKVSIKMKLNEIKVEPKGTKLPSFFSQIGLLQHKHYLVEPALNAV